MTKQEYLCNAMQFFGIKIDMNVANIVWELVPLINAKGGETDILDLCKIMEKVGGLEPKQEEPKPKYDSGINPHDNEDFRIYFRWEFGYKVVCLFDVLLILNIDDLYKYSYEEIGQVRGYGKKTIESIRTTLKNHNLPPLKEIQ